MLLHSASYVQTRWEVPVSFKVSSLDFQVRSCSSLIFNEFVVQILIEFEEEDVTTIRRFISSDMQTC